MSIDEIIEYVMNTPDNSNPRVLRDMLNELGGSGEADVKLLTADYDFYWSTLHNTYAEIENWIKNGSVVLINSYGNNPDGLASYGIIKDYGQDEFGYYIWSSDADAGHLYYATTKSDYPKIQWE